MLWWGAEQLHQPAAGPEGTSDHPVVELRTAPPAHDRHAVGERHPGLQSGEEAQPRLIGPLEGPLGGEEVRPLQGHRVVVHQLSHAGPVPVGEGSDEMLRYCGAGR